MMLVYRIRPDGVFDGEVEVPDGPIIPAGHTRTAPPAIPPGSHAVMRGGWEIVTGETPPYLPAPPPVPAFVTPLQMRRALLQQGLLDDVEEFVQSADLEARMAWEYAVEIRRTDALIVHAASALGKTEAEIDDLFRLAATF
jgi:hypothetical protein